LSFVERRLSKIGGKSKESTSREIISSLAKVRNDAVLTMVRSSSVTEEFCCERTDANSAYKMVEKILFPEKQALTTQELQKLVDQDILAKFHDNSLLKDKNTVAEDDKS